MWAWAGGLKRERPNIVEQERKLLVKERLDGPEPRPNDTTMQIGGLEARGCTDQKDLAFVGPKGGDGLGSLQVEVAVVVSLHLLNQSVPGVVAFELHNGTCVWF